MECGIDDEVPEAEATLVPVGEDLVRVLDLVTDHLMQLAALELDLLLVELVLDDVRASLGRADVLLVPLLLVVDLGHARRDRLATVSVVVVGIVV